MKHLKLFEAFGIDSNIENQANDMFKEIGENPSKNKFNFLYQNDVGNFFFDLIVDKDIRAEGHFVHSSTDELSIILKNRSDQSTLLHELKHLDYYTKNKKIYQTLHYKANQIISQYPDAPATLVEIFYLFDENEFQSKYHGYYSDFDKFLKGKISSDTTINGIKNLFITFLTDKNTDQSWNWYVYNKKIKFSDFVSKRKLDICFYNMLDKKETKGEWSKSLIINSIKMAWDEFRNKIGLRSYTSAERKEIDKLIKYFEKEIQNRQAKFYRKFLRIIPLVAKKNNIKY